MSLFSKDVGIDLGTANTLVYMKGKGIIMREPSVVAVDTKSDEVRCVGAEAKAVIGRTPGSIVAVRPLKDGVIADFDITANMLENFLKKACGNSMFSRPRVVICIPSGVTEVERRAVREATLKAGARQVSVIEEPMAAAIGAGLPISEPTGSMIVDIGGGTAEIAVISLGGIVASRSVRMAGDMFDQAIIAFIKRKYNLLIGERTAEQIKIEIGSAYVLDPEMTMEIKGRNLVDGDLEAVEHRQSGVVIEKKREYDIDFSPSGIELDNFPYNSWRKVSRAVMSEEAGLFNIGEPQGDEEFRETIADYLHESRGVNCSPNNIIVGAGDEYLLMLLDQLLCDAHKGALSYAMENPA